MAVEIFYDDDTDLSIIQNRHVAVLGYGSQGHAHALSLRDSGVDVRVGLLEGSKSRGKAEAEGLRVVTPSEACEEADLVISFHVFEGGGATVGYEIQGIKNPACTGAWVVVAPGQMDEILASVILSGVCERHPRLRLVLGESGIGWLPYLLERMDDTYEERLADDLKLSLPPSAYFKRQIYATFQKDFHGVRAMAEIAPDNVMWGSDYPHRDGTWPFSQKAIDEQFHGIDESIKRKMLGDNVRRVYRITS